MGDERHEEWAVVDDTDHIAGWPGQIRRSRDDAEAYLAWLVGPRRDELRQDAEAEDLEKCNWAHVAWAKEQQRTYRIIRREVTPWREADD